MPLRNNDNSVSTNSVNETSDSHPNGTGPASASALFTSEIDSTGLETLTDLTSMFTSSAITDSDTEGKVTKEMIQRKQLMHDVELLKVELSQKNLMIDTMKAEHLSKVDELEDKLSDAIHQKQLLLARFENQIRLRKGEADKEIKRLKQELQESSRQKQDLWKENQELARKTISDRAELTDFGMSEDEYLDLKGKKVDDLSAREFVSLKFYEEMHPLRIQCETLQQRNAHLTNDVRDFEDELARKEKELEEERTARAELEVRCQKFQIQLEDVRNQLSHKDYKNENFDAMRSEKDTMERDFIDLKKNYTMLSAEMQSKLAENDELRKEIISQSQTVALLKQDKDYLSKELFELKPRYSFLEQRLEETAKQLDSARGSREDLYEKYIHSRGHLKSEYEEKLRKELEEISRKTSAEIDKIKSNAQEIFERENRSLKESKDNALAEKERALISAKEHEDKYNQLLEEFRQLQVTSDSKVSDFHNDIRLKTFEIDRLQLTHEETLTNLKQANLENEKLRKKNETVSKEYYSLQMALSKRVADLEGREKELQSKLNIYEKLEQELDDVVMQAAELKGKSTKLRILQAFLQTLQYLKEQMKEAHPFADEKEAERVMFSYGYGANVPSTAKRRMQQSVHLARRVLQLERANTSLRSEFERESKKKDQLSEELSRATTLLDEAQQPYNYLIESIRVRDEENKTLKGTISTLEEDCRRLKDERLALKKVNDQLTADLERLLNQKEEMNVLKQVVIGLKSKDSTRPPSSHKLHAGPFIKRKQVRMSQVEHPEENTYSSTPKPTVIVKPEAPSWYNRLKLQSYQRSDR